MAAATCALATNVSAEISLMDTSQYVIGSIGNFSSRAYYPNIVGQTFNLANATTLQSFSLFANGGANGAFGQAFLTKWSNDKPSEILYASSISEYYVSTFSSTVDELRFSTNEILLSPNQEYAILMRFYAQKDGALMDGFINMAITNAKTSGQVVMGYAGYSPGGSVRDSIPITSAQWSMPTGSSLAFRLEGVSAVPEPASAYLAVLGILGSIRYRKRAQRLGT
jgi:hypothetical protein